ncbi:hypothetical protein EZMO1_2758 [Endozoicomonas montiporae CL-33]|nr:hypothetical protein EZMO1_2758 [Endozoicomonas montiporae CL-33]
MPAEVSAPLSKAAAKAEFLDGMPDLEQRRIDKREQEINRLRVAVETPDSALLSPQITPTTKNHEAQAEPESDADNSNHVESAPEAKLEPVAYQSKKTVLSKLIRNIAKKAIASTDLLGDSKDIEESKKRKKAAKKNYEKARELCVATEDRIETLNKKIKKLEAKLKESKLFTSSRTRKLQEKRQELAEKNKSLPTLREQTALCFGQFNAAVQSYDTLAGNGKKLIDSLSRFLASVRSFYAATHSKQEKTKDVRMDIPVDHLVLNTPDGQVQLNNARLSIAGIDFVKGPGGKMCPVFKIAQLEATTAVDMPDGEVINARISAKGLKAGLSGSVGQMLFNYITASNPLSAGYGLLTEIGNVTQVPDFVSLSAQDISIELPEFTTGTAASIIKNIQASPEPGIDALFKKLNFRLSAKVDNVSVSTRGNLKAGGTFSGIEVDYRPEIPTAQATSKKGTTPGQLCVQCSKAEVGMSNALAAINELQQVLTPSSPFGQWQNIALPLNQPPPYADGPPPPYSKTEPDSPEFPGLNPDTERPAQTKTIKAGDLMSLTGRTGFSASDITLTMKRAVEGVGTQNVRLSGNDHIDASIDKLTVMNQGDMAATLIASDINSHVTLSDGTPLTTTNDLNLKPAELNADIAAGHVKVNISAPTGKMVESALGDSTFIKGQLELEAVEPFSASCIKRGDQLTVKSTVPALRADVTQPFLLSRNGNGVHLPEGHVQLKGNVEVLSNKQVATIKPNLALNSEDNLELLIDGHNIPLELSTAISVEKASPRLFVREDPQTAVKTMTPVISRGELNFDRLKAGPINIGQITVALDGENFGSLHITEADVSLKAVTDLIYPPVQENSTSAIELPAPMKNPIVKWLIKRIARHQHLVCDAQLKIIGGAVDLKQLDKIDLKLVPTSESRFNRFISWALNKVVRRYTKQLLRFSLAVEERKFDSLTDGSQATATEHSLSAGSESSSKTDVTVQRVPVLKLPAPIGIDVALPLPVDCFRTEDKTISLSSLLRQNTGALVVAEADIEAFESALKEVDAGNPAAVNRLMEFIEQHHNDPAYQGFIHLIARQFPIQAIEQMFQKQPDIKQSLAPKLLECADKLLSHPELCMEAAHISQLAGQPLNLARIKQVIAQADDNPHINLTGLAMQLETALNRPDLAKSCYEKALERNPEDPLANRCLGKLLLNEQCQRFNFNDVHAAYEHLLTAWRAGDRTISRELEQLEHFNSQNLDAAHNAIIGRAAKLRLGMICLEEEKDHHDFTMGMSRLVELARQTNDPLIQQQAVKLIEHRRSIGDLTFHTVDPKVFQETRKQLDAAYQHLRKLNIKALQPFAKELGIKCLYGSHGAVQNLDLAYQLLLVADSQGDHEAHFHLRLVQSAFKPKKQRFYDQLKAAAASAA